MPINTSTFVLSAIAENAAGVPRQKALPIALFASTLRPMTGLLFALLLGKSALASSPTSTTTTPPAPATGGPGGSGSGSSGQGGTTIPSTMPSFLHMSRADATAWAAVFQLQPTFNPVNPDKGRIVIGQIPDVGDPVPTSRQVTLRMAEHIRQDKD